METKFKPIYVLFVLNSGNVRGISPLVALPKNTKWRDVGPLIRACECVYRKCGIFNIIVAFEVWRDGELVALDADRLYDYWDRTKPLGDTTAIFRLKSVQRVAESNWKDWKKGDPWPSHDFYDAYFCDLATT